MKNRLYIIIGVITILFGLAVTGAAQAAKDKSLVTKELPPATGKVAEVSGEISGVSKDYISVVYNKDEAKGVEYEVLLPIDKDMQIKNKNSVSELNVGDTVSVQYEEDVITDSQEKQILKRKSRVLNFIKAAPPKPVVPVEEEVGI